MKQPLTETQHALGEVVAGIGSAQLVAIDTEFVREKTYYPELCLVQVATPDFVACVDCLAGLDTDEFFAALTGHGHAGILHSARQDLEVIWNSSERLPARLIDTQVAAALIGLEPQISLRALLEKLLDVRIAKDQGREVWNRRPLPAAAIDYALDDVRYLIPVWEALETELRARDRLGWFEEECARLIDAPLEPSAVNILERLRGAGSLDAAGRQAALAAVQWREERARSRNLPRRWVLADDALLAVARARPRNPKSLLQVAGVTDRFARRHADSLLATLAEAAERELPASMSDARQVRPDKTRLKALQDAIRARAGELGIAPELLATRRDAKAIETGQTPEHLRHGWRAEVLRDLLP